VKLATVRTQPGVTQAARIEGDELVLLDQPDAATALAQEATATGGDTIGLAAADLGPPSVRPPKIICVGLNYETHILEMGRDLPAHPTLFAKYTRALIGPNDPIILPAVSDQVDWEAELTAVIGREVRHANPDEAREAIAGYTIMNDVSMRDFQWRTAQWLAGKTFERSTPTGPMIVTPDEVDDAADLEIRCEVDGEVMQRSRTSDLVFSPADIVAYVSQIMTLEPGDLIATGTPGGVGAGRDPQVFLKAGQEVRTIIEGIGELVNVCVDEEAA
jgi:acylpyruvate hydrolase